MTSSQLSRCLIRDKTPSLSLGCMKQRCPYQCDHYLKGKLCTTMCLNAQSLVSQVAGLLCQPFGGKQRVCPATSTVLQQCCTPEGKSGIFLNTDEGCCAQLSVRLQSWYLRAFFSFRVHLIVVLSTKFHHYLLFTKEKNREACTKIHTGERCVVRGFS